MHLTWPYPVTPAAYVQMKCPMVNPLDCHQLGVVMENLFNHCGLQFSPGSETAGKIAKMRYGR